MINPILKIIYINQKFDEHPIAKNNKIISWINYLIYNIKIRKSQRLVKFKWINNLSIYVENGDSCLGGNVFLVLMEFSESAFLVHYLNSSDLFVDVGANLGHFTLLASGICGSRTIAIEPIPKTYHKLCFNVKKNNINQLVTIKNIGVSNKRGNLNFTDFQNNAINFVQNNVDKKSITVPVQTLNNLLKGKSPNVLKIDVEGFELFVLKGATEILTNPNLKIIIIELNGHCKRYGNTENEIYKFIINFGFKPVNYIPFNRKIELLNHYNLNSDNTIFIREINYVKKRINNGGNIQLNNNIKL